MNLRPSATETLLIPDFPYVRSQKEDGSLGFIRRAQRNTKMFSKIQLDAWGNKIWRNCNQFAARKQQSLHFSSTVCPQLLLLYPQDQFPFQTQEQGATCSPCCVSLSLLDAFLGSSQLLGMCQADLPCSIAFPRTPCVTLARCHVCSFDGHPEALLSVKTHRPSPLWL